MWAQVFHSTARDERLRTLQTLLHQITHGLTIGTVLVGLTYLFVKDLASYDVLEGRAMCARHQFYVRWNIDLEFIEVLDAVDLLKLFNQPAA